MPTPVHVHAPFAAVLVPMLERVFPDRPIVAWSRPEEFIRGIPEAELLLTIFSPQGHWGRAQRLRFVQAMGVGVDSVLADDLPAEVVVACNRGAAAPTMSEFGLALVMALLKQLPRAIQQQHERTWRPFLAEPVAGRTLGILGAGAIGMALAEKAHALGMRVIAVQRTPKPHPVLDRVYASDDLDRVLEEADVVVVLLPLTPQTRGLLSAERLARMKPGAKLVNLARGGIVDEVALRRALEEGALGGAAFDVFAREPLPPDDPLWEAPHLLLTPHVAGGYPEYLPRIVELFAENVRRIESGQPPHNLVDRERGY